MSTKPEQTALNDSNDSGNQRDGELKNYADRSDEERSPTPCLSGISQAVFSNVARGRGNKPASLNPANYHRVALQDAFNGCIPNILHRRVEQQHRVVVDHAPVAAPDLPVKLHNAPTGIA